MPGGASVAGLPTNNPPVGSRFALRCSSETVLGAPPLTGTPTSGVGRRLPT
nr:MAG TPA: hypothetical protein [Caudoviricetes sp.]